MGFGLQATNEGPVANAGAQPRCFRGVHRCVREWCAVNCNRSSIVFDSDSRAVLASVLPTARTLYSQGSTQSGVPSATCKQIAYIHPGKTVSDSGSLSLNNYIQNPPRNVDLFYYGLPGDLIGNCLTSRCKRILLRCVDIE